MVFNYLAVADIDYFPAVMGYIRVVSHDNNSFFLVFVQICQRFHNYLPCAGIQISGRFVSYYDFRVICQ